MSEFKQTDEERISRQQAAERLTDIAYALTQGQGLQLRGSDEAPVPVADQVVLRREGKIRGDRFDLHLELGWSMPSGSRQRTAPPRGRPER